jgi:hypothetical protein
MPFSYFILMKWRGELYRFSCSPKRKIPPGIHGIGRAFESARSNNLGWAYEKASFDGCRTNAMGACGSGCDHPDRWYLWRRYRKNRQGALARS